MDKPANLVTLHLPVEQVNGILQALNSLPTSSNAWPVVQSIVQQANAQQNQPKDEG